ncbi:MAG: hypothetical protein LQ338_003752 [Usnochroma carphineum]|nr:MAG: hypothetical protein LQ338_003752 [Usnochroma carphineum]
MDATVHITDRYNRSQMIGLGIFFIFLPVVAVVLRVWAKLLGPRGVVGDDILIFFGLAFAIGCGSIQLIAAIDGQLGQHQTVKSDGQPLLNDPRFALYEKCKLAVNILSTVGLGFTKSAFLLFYMSIFTTKRFRIIAQVVLAIVMGWTISFFFANLFTCYPISPFIESFYHNNCVNGLALWYSMAISDIIVDFFIILLPIPMVLKLHLPLAQRIGVLAMFMLGAA